MRTKAELTKETLTKLGGAAAGTASALGIGREAAGITLFLGTAVGLYRASSYEAGGPAEWERLANAPIGIVSLAVSPLYAQDHTLIAGSNTGVFLSTDGGETWLSARTPLAGSIVNTISFSPNYAQDGCLLAGTVEDGIIFSNNRGATWLTRNFGLYDAAVFSIGFSPLFSSDDIAFAGSDTAVYHSYNGGRAWKMTNFPESAAPAMSLAVSPDFGSDRTLLVGTEAAGLFRSTDAGTSWEQTSLPAACINALLFVSGSGVLAATDAGVFLSEDGGATWACILDEPDIISLAANDGLVMAGPAGQGAWLTTDLENWQPVGQLAALPVVGLVLPTGFAEAGVAFMYGPGEGIWRTTDGGVSWESLDESLPTADIRAMAVSPNFAEDRIVAAVSEAGVLISEDSGSQWTAVSTEPARQVAFAPNGRRLAVGLVSGNIMTTDDLGKSWRAVPADWGTAGTLAALAVGTSDQFFAAVVEGIGETLSIWQGKPGEFEKVHSQQVGENPVATFWIPAEPAADRPWYASIGSQVLKFSSRKGRPASPVTVFEDSETPETILSLAGIQDQGRTTLLAATGRHVYKSVDGQTWTQAHDFGNERAVTVVVTPNYSKDKTLYALLIGGTLARFTVR